MINNNEKEIIKDINNFKIELSEEEKKERTIKQYIKYLYEFIEYENIDSKQDITKEKLIEYKEHLREIHPKTSSVNIKIIIINKFIMFLELPDKMKLQQIRVQTKTSLDNVLNDKEYQRLLEWALKLNKTQMYYLMKTLAGTGIRISELKYITVEAVNKGAEKIHNKKKDRDIIIKTSLQKELKKYCEETGIKEGIIFKSKQGNVLSDSYIWRQLQYIAGKARGGLNKNKVHAHSFRHLFAKEFMANGGNQMDLANILGHSSLETTRIYTTMSTTEQRNLLNEMDKRKKRRK